MANVNFLLIDCGNTSTDFYGCNTAINQSVYGKINNNHFKSIQIKSLIEFVASRVELESFFDAYIASVNSLISPLIIKTLEKMNVAVHILDELAMCSFKESFSYKIDNTDILGSDLFADIVSLDLAKDQIICDCGTASKILVLNKNKEFIGGVIYPGIDVCNKLLTNSTDKLQNYNLKNPNELVSLNTQECISSGSINGTYFLIEGFIREITKEYQLENPRIIFTGGNTNFIVENKYFDKSFNYIVDPLHTIKGIARTFNIKLPLTSVAHIDLDPMYFIKYR